MSSAGSDPLDAKNAPVTDSDPRESSPHGLQSGGVYLDFRGADLSNSNNAFGSSEFAQKIAAPTVGQAAAAVQPITAVRPAASTFVGRVDELARLTTVLNPREEGSLIAIAGAPGVGKTELATHAAKSAMASGRFAFGFYVEMRGYAENAADRVVPDRVYASLLRGLGVAGDDIPVTSSEQSVVYHALMARLADAGRPVLLWLDNVSDSAQIKSLLPGDSTHRVMITSRETLGELRAKTLEVQVLDRARAIELLNAAVGDRNPGDTRLLDDAQSAAQLAELCGYLPLALQIVAALVADEPTRPVSEVASELADESSRLDGLEYYDDWSVRAAFELSYRRLDEDHRRLFRLLALVPGGDVSKAAAAALCDEAEGRTRQKLMRLVRSHLLEQHVLDRWQMHDLIRLYATELVGSDTEDASQAYTRLLERYFRDVVAAAEHLAAVASSESRAIFGSVAEAAEWLDAERATLVEIVLDAGARTEDRYRIAAVNLGSRLGDLLRRDRHVDDWLTTATITAKIAQEIADKSTHAFALTNLGSALREANQLPEALAAHRRARVLYKELGDKRLLGVVLNNIGNVNQQLGKFSEAIDAYQQDLAICEEINDRHGEALARTNLGAVLVKPNNRDRDPNRAVRELELAIKIYTNLGDQNGEARALNHLGGALLRLDPEKAIGVLQKASDLYRDQRNRVGEASARSNLGSGLMGLGQHADAIPHFEFFLETSAALGVTSHEMMARTNLGIALSVTGHPEPAVSHLKQGARLAQQTGDKYHEAKIRHNLGVILGEMHRASESRAEFLEAAELYAAIGDVEQAAAIRRHFSR